MNNAIRPLEFDELDLVSGGHEIYMTAIKHLVAFNAIENVIVGQEQPRQALSGLVSRN